MGSLAQKLSVIVGDAFEAQGLDRAFGLVRVSDRPDLAQFQCNGAMAAAKAAKKNPREVAETIRNVLYKLHPNMAIPTLSAEDRASIQAAIDKGVSFSSLLIDDNIFSMVGFSKAIAGPGFINLNVTDEYLIKHLKETASEERMGVSDFGHNETVVIDYGGANVAKAMHVGHLRPAVIGDSVYRILKFAGYNVIGDVHLGDWGTNMGMLVDDYITTKEQDIILKADLGSADDIQRVMDDMAERYPKAATAAKEDTARMARALAATVKIQNKEDPFYSIWERAREISVMGLKQTYGALGVEFDLWKGEADVHDYIAPMVDELRARGWAVEDAGAWIVPIVQNDDKKEMPPLILYKRDGAVMYGTTDMATIVERVKLYNPAKMVYVVDQRQALHFEQVFRAVRKGGIVRDNVELTHAGFGTLNGPDGKPFKTRNGGVMRLEEFIEMTKDKARQRLKEANLAADMPENEFEDVARKVAIAAIKFADLQNARQADYVFDIDRLTSFEGKTGPYLLYQAVRIKSLLKKADWPIGQLAAFDLQDVDRPLALLLTELPDAVEGALKAYAPHYLCDYAYRLAQAFSSFYGNCHILSETNEELRNSRLTLCSITVRQLELVLSLLGIETPERM